MKKFVLIGIFVFIFFGCGGSSVPQYKTGDSVVIIKNINKSTVISLKSYIKEGLEKQFKGSPIVFKLKDYKSESCISFGFKFKDVEAKNGFIQTEFTKGASKCTIQDHSIGDEDLKGESGLVVFFRLL